jgi:hypothetical protein
MPDAAHYLRQANALLSMSLGVSNPVIAAKLWELAEEYLAKAVKLRVDDGLPALPRSSAARYSPLISPASIKSRLKRRACAPPSHP